MKETSPDGPYIDRLRSWAQSKVHGGNRSAARRPSSEPDLLPISTPRTRSTLGLAASGSNHGATLASNSSDALAGASNAHSSSGPGSGSSLPHAAHAAAPHSGPPGRSPFSSSPQASRKGSQLGGPFAPVETTHEKNGQSEHDTPTLGRVQRFFVTFKKIILHSWLNLLLVFVPIGIAVELVPGMNPGVIFGMNAVAIVPLAGLLSLATEVVAHRMGDAVGALMNVTFGNAVELIILIALVKNEIRIVQASILGSIIANLLLILGMAFLLGGLRYREQIYNSTVTQMSACLLSLSVISLVLPTAFHASFQDQDFADKQSLVISRGTSIILLLVYAIYLLFQLKSHAYMYESTPQEVIDAEATPGPAVAWFDSSSSDDSSSASSDTDSSARSRNTIQKRMKRMVRRRRKSSGASTDTVDTGPLQARPSPGVDASPGLDDGPPGEQPRRVRTNSTMIVDGDDTSEDERRHRRRYRKRRSRRDRKQRKKNSHGTDSPCVEQTLAEIPEAAEKGASEPRRVDFAPNAIAEMNMRPLGDGGVAPRRTYNALLALTPLAKNLTPSVFAQPANAAELASVSLGPVPRVRYGIRRTNSLPGRLSDPRQQQHTRPPGALFPSQLPARSLHPASVAASGEDPAAFEADISRVSAVIMLLISTGLVAVCAEFMVGSIDGLVETSNVSEVFIGLIILPIVGNAAEHVTAITVAMKNKMDLAIGVAVGSSIQIALFMSPLTVIIGWCMGRDMTLYFTLFQTVCLFVSAFITNFLVLDGRSNYLEGALLCATYVIIALVAFFYPNQDQLSQWG